MRKLQFGPNICIKMHIGKSYLDALRKELDAGVWKVKVETGKNIFLEKIFGRFATCEWKPLYKCNAHEEQRAWSNKFSYADSKFNTMDNIIMKLLLARA